MLVFLRPLPLFLRTVDSSEGRGPGPRHRRGVAPTEAKEMGCNARMAPRRLVSLSPGAVSSQASKGQTGKKRTCSAAGVSWDKWSSHPRLISLNSRCKKGVGANPWPREAAVLNSSACPPAVSPLLFPCVRSCELFFCSKPTPALSSQASSLLSSFALSCCLPALDRKPARRGTTLCFVAIAVSLLTTWHRNTRRAKPKASSSTSSSHQKPRHGRETRRPKGLAGRGPAPH